MTEQKILYYNTLFKFYKTNSTLQMREEEDKFGAQIEASSKIWLNFRARRHTYTGIHFIINSTFLAKSNWSIWRCQNWILEPKLVSNYNSVRILEINDLKSFSFGKPVSIWPLRKVDFGASIGVGSKTWLNIRAG